MTATYQSYFSVIPARVRGDPGLSANAKLLFGELSSLAQVNGYCWAANDHFASVLGVSERTVRRLLAELTVRGHIRTILLRDDTSGQIAGRRIFPFWNPPEMPEEPIENVPIKAEGQPDRPPADDAPNDQYAVHTEEYTPEDKNVHWPVDIFDRLYNVEYKIYINNKNGKRKKDADAREELINWAVRLPQMTEQCAKDLIAAMMSFCDMRLDRKKELRPGRAVTLLTNRLMKYSNGNISTMIALLDESVFRQWDSVYPPSSDSGSVQQPPGNSAEDGGPKWL